MTLIDDLRALDLSAVLDAKVSISATIDAGGIRAVLDAGPISVLGDVGAATDRLRAVVEQPEGLVADALAGITGIVDGLGRLDLPIGDLVDTVRDAAARLVDLFPDLATDPLGIARLTGRSLGDALSAAQQLAGDHLGEVVEAVEDVIEVVGLFDGDLPTQPEAIVALALDLLTPFGADALAAVRATVDAVVGGAGGLDLPARTAGLVVKLDAVARVAADGRADPAALARAVAELEDVRRRTMAQLGSDLGDLMASIDRIPLDDLARAIEVLGSLSPPTGDVLAVLEDWRRDIVTFRELLANADFAPLAGLLAQGVDLLEGGLRSTVVEPVSAAVDVAVAALGRLLADNPVRAVRATVRTALQDAALQVTELADPAIAVREAVTGLADQLGVADLADRARAALADVRATVGGALDDVEEAVDRIRDAVDDIAGAARDVIAPAVDVLVGFQETLDGAADLVDGLDLSAAAAEVVEAVRGIRTAAEAVLSEVPLPEPIRPLVTQLIAELEAVREIDVTALPPVQALRDGFAASVDAGRVVADTVRELDGVLANLLPTSLVAELDGMFGAALDAIAGFDPASLTSGLSGVLDDVAGLLDGFDLGAMLAPVGALFDQLLAGWDELRPSQLLAPAVAAFDEVVSVLEPPDALGLARNVAGAIGTATSGVGRIVGAPATRLAGTPPPAGTTPAVPPGGPPPGPDRLPAGELPVKVGDAVRMLGWLPARLREALDALDAGTVGSVLASIDGMTRSLAADLRRVVPVIDEVGRRLAAALDGALLPVGDAQVRAQLALSARAALPVGDGVVRIDVGAAVQTVAICGPGALRAGLSGPGAAMRGRVDRLVGRHSSLAARLERLATALDQLSLTGALGSVDAFLAALDPEPIAAELDRLVADALARVPELVGLVREGMITAVRRMEAIFAELHPVAQLQQARRLLDALYAEIDQLDPRGLITELDELHAAVRLTLAAYDPTVLAAELTATIAQIAGGLRALDPASLLGDLTELQAVVDRAATLRPSELLAGVGAPLTALAEAFDGIDLDRALSAVDGLPDRVVASAERAFDDVFAEVIALLEALRYATGDVQVSVTVTT